MTKGNGNYAKAKMNNFLEQYEYIPDYLILDK